MNGVDILVASPQDEVMNSGVTRQIFILLSIICVGLIVLFTIKFRNMKEFRNGIVIILFVILIIFVIIAIKAGPRQVESFTAYLVRVDYQTESSQFSKKYELLKTVYENSKYALLWVKEK